MYQQKESNLQTPDLESDGFAYLPMLAYKIKIRTGYEPVYPQGLINRANRLLAFSKKLSQCISGAYNLSPPNFNLHFGLQKLLDISWH